MSGTNSLRATIGLLEMAIAHKDDRLISVRIDNLKTIAASFERAEQLNKKETHEENKQMNAKEARKLAQETRRKIVFNRIEDAATKGLTHVYFCDGDIDEELMTELKDLGYMIIPSGTIRW